MFDQFLRLESAELSIFSRDSRLDFPLLFCKLIIFAFFIISGVFFEF